MECPFCASRGVRKAIMAPAVAGTRTEAPGPDVQAMMLEAAGRMRKHVEETFENVGDSFAAEARAIHEGEADERGIYGQASPAEVRELVEDACGGAAAAAGRPSQQT